jgi:hypothetical protein
VVTDYPVLAAVALTLAHGVLTSQAQAQQFEYRGFADFGVVAHPQEAPNDPTQVIVDGQARLESSLRLRQRVVLAASLEGRLNSHDQTTRQADLTYWDRTLKQPTLAVRTLNATLAHGPFTLEMGKQFVRWGQSDIVSPTDYFSPRDYIVPLKTEVLAPTAARFTYATGNTSLEVVYAPVMTPSRAPLLDQRWIGLRASLTGLTLRDVGALYPGGGQYGLRWRRNDPRIEYSASFFQGFQHLPSFHVTPSPDGASADIERRYPAIRGWGADAAAPLLGVAVKAEAAWLKALNKDADDYGMWVAQVERQQAQWLFIGGWVGEWVTAERGVLSFAPTRGLAETVLARVSKTLDGNRSFFVESILRVNADGFYARGEYSHGVGAHWRVTLQALFIRGVVTDFLGQYRLNSLTDGRARYSF